MIKLNKIVKNNNFIQNYDIYIIWEETKKMTKKKNRVYL
jgi:hypothetical protein